MDELYDGFIEKTDYLTETKGLLKDRINSLGGSITSGTTFRDYLVWLDSLYEALEEKTITGLPDSLEGKCEQTGTPTPTSPQPINITTGRQVVSVCGKNFLPPPNEEGTLEGRGITINFNTSNEYKFTGTATSTGIIGSTTGCPLQSIYTIQSGDYLHLNYDVLPTGTIQIVGLKENNTQSFAITINSANKIYSLSNYAGTKLKGFFFYALSGVNTNNMTLKPMIVKSSTETTYEEYKGQDYEINLGKNLMEINNITSNTIVGVTFTKQADGSVLINGTSTSANDTWVVLSNVNYTSLYGTPTINIGQVQQSIKSGKQGDFTLSASITNGTLKSFSYNSSNNATACLIGAGASFDNAVLTVQLEKGDLSSYTPYKTPIYLGKIGTYQDYIFRNTTENPLYDSNLEEGQWYIHKEIGRYEFLGTENFTASQWGTNSWDLENIIATTYNTNELQIICNIFKGIPHANRATGGNNIIYTFGNTGFEIRNTTYSTLTDIRNATKGNYIYWVLNTPTNTLIEDEELINQLNEIEIFTVISEDFYN